MTFNCKLLSPKGYKKRFAMISNHWVDFYKNRDSRKAKHSEKMEDIHALYINSEENQLVLKTSETPNIVLKTKHGRDVLRLLYAINMRDGCQVFQIPEEDLDEYLNDEEFPKSSYLISGEDENGDTDLDDLSIDYSSDDVNIEDEQMPNVISSMGQKVSILPFYQNRFIRL